jgi:hypothetical protein
LLFARESASLGIKILLCQKCNLNHTIKARWFFFQGKPYGLGRIKARLKETSESWIAGIFMVLNLVKLAGVALPNA